MPRKSFRFRSRTFWRSGGETANDSSEPFNMAYLAIRGSGAVNGVSQLHGQVSRRIFQSLFPRWPETEVPVTHVTNGVHTPTWDSAEADRLWEVTCGKDRWREATEDLEKRFSQRQRLRSLATSRRWPQISRRVRSQTARPAAGGPGRIFRGTRAGRAGARRQHADSGLCPPFCDLQAPEPSLA